MSTADPTSAEGELPPPAAGELVLARDAGPVRWLTLNRPHRLNALTADSYRALRAALVAADGDEAVAVVVLTGAGRAFCAGADLTELPGTDRGRLVADFEALVLALAGLSKPLVAGVHGAAVGLGMTMLLHCDLVVVAESARLRAPFTELGTVPEAMSSVLLPRAVGAQRAAELLLTSRWVSSAEAVEYGLAIRRCPDADLDAVTGELAARIGAFPAPAVAATKRLLRAGPAEPAEPAKPAEPAEPAAAPSAGIEVARAVLRRELAEGAALSSRLGGP